MCAVTGTTAAIEGDIMPKRNREKLMEQSLYDLLCSMNETMKKLQDDGHTVCVLDALGVESGYCKGSNLGCEKCISRWLNEFPF